MSVCALYVDPVSLSFLAIFRFSQISCLVFLELFVLVGSIVVLVYFF